MKSETRIITAIISLLVIAVAVLIFLNRGDAALKQALQENRQFLLKVDGEVAAIVGLQDVLDLKPEEFTTRLSTSATLPRDTVLQGVELRRIYRHFDIDTSGAKLYAVRGLDGYFSPLRAEEVAAENKIYVCIAMDGAILTDKSSGGWGPFLLVIRGSAFAQRWCKYIEEIDAQQ